MARRYEFYVLLTKTISLSFASLPCGRIVLPLEHKINIQSRHREISSIYQKIISGGFFFPILSLALELLVFSCKKNSSWPFQDNQVSFQHILVAEHAESCNGFLMIFVPRAARFISALTINS